MPARRAPAASAVSRGRPGVAFGVGCALMAAGLVSVALRELPSLQLRNRYTVMGAALVPYGMLAFAAAAVVFATSSARWVRPIAIAAVAGVALQGWWARPYWPAIQSASTAASEPLTLISMNLRCNPGGVPDLVALTAKTQPDVVVLEGFRLDESDSLSEQWTQLLPYKAFHPMAGLTTCGTIVYSRTPVRELTSAGDAQPVMQIDRPDGAFLLLPIDFPTPSNGIPAWLDAFARLTASAKANHGRPMVVVGDFNAVREHAPMRQLLQTTGLRDAAQISGSGWLPTFPSRSWHPALIGLDHALISAEIGASVARTEGIRDQEHRALVVTISVPRQNG